MLALSAACLAQESPRIAASKLTVKPKIDGILDPGEWQGATKLAPFLDPFTGKPTADQTEGWIAYDEEAIYVAFHAHDSQPRGIVGREIQPGAEFDGEDELIFRVNTFGTRTWDSMSRFAVNVLNTQNEEIAGGRASKREWRGDWQSGTKRVADGWTAEMRIPWKILNYPSGQTLAMDVNLLRYQARTKIESMWANQGPAERPELMGRWENVQPPATRFRPKWEYLAYAASEYEDRKFGFRSGIDARYRMTPTMTGLLSINPDFRNIENEIAGIEFTRTERFLDEARPFFNEGSDFFDLTGDFTFGKMFYSQRIRAFDVGAKVFGKLDPSLSMGALTTLDNGRTSATVARLRKEFGPFSSLSAYATRESEGGRQNLAGGLGLYKRWGNFWLDGQVASERTNSEHPDTAGAVGFAYEGPKWFALVRTEWVQPDFDPALAYIPWKDRKGYYGFIEHHDELRKGPVREYGFDAFIPQFTTYAHNVQERGYNVGTYLTTQSDIRVNISRSRMTFEDGPEESTGVGFTINDSNRFKRIGFRTENGTRSGDPSRFNSVYGSYRAFRSVDIGVSFNEQRYKGVDRQTVATLGYEISPTRSITGRVVRHNSSTNAYLAFRQGGGKGAEYYLILGDPNANSTRTRISVKAVWAF